MDSAERAEARRTAEALRHFLARYGGDPNAPSSPGIRAEAAAQLLRSVKAQNEDLEAFIRLARRAAVGHAERQVQKEIGLEGDPSTDGTEAHSQAVAKLRRHRDRGLLSEDLDLVEGVAKLLDIMGWEEPRPVAQAGNKPTPEIRPGDQA